MPYFGKFLIFAACCCTLLSGILYFLSWRGKENVLGLGRKLFAVSTLLIVGALGSLMYLILSHDFSVAYVYSYSSTDLPLGYLIATLWGGQEGTFLLWLFYTAIFGLILQRTSGQFERGNMVFLNLFILSLLLIVMKRSPFALSPVFHAEGAGLNPLLQNFWMQIHPPIMFVGFSATVFPFIFAMTGLVERKYQLWSEAARRWTMFAWATLGTSLVMGGYWAYETLGWGGFWAWDPVENSSLIPWLFLTAQVHALFIKRVRRGLMRFSLVAVCLSFWSVLYGTFLTRSGVLADFSVHSFVDLGINAFLVTGLFLFIGLGSFMLFWRWRDISPEPSFSSVKSRSYLVTLGVVILFLGAVLVLLGTSAPLLTRMTENPSNVGMQYYFATMTPIAVAILALITLFPVFYWNNGLAKPRLLLTAGMVCVTVLIALLVARVTTTPLYLLLFGTAASAIVVNAFVLVQTWREGKFSPGYLSHVGLAVALIGAAASAGFETKENVRLVQGMPTSALGGDYNFVSVTQNQKGFVCHIDVTSSGRAFTADLSHEFPRNAEGVMKKPHVESFLSHDLYLAPQSFEPASGEEPGTLTLGKGESARIEKYLFTFQKFDVSGGHAEAAGEVMSAKAQLVVEYDGKTENVAPELRVDAKEVTPIARKFDNDRGEVVITAIRPEDGGVKLKVSGTFVPPNDSKPAVLVVEVSQKPLILLFWIGTAIIFIGGGLSMIERRRRKMRTSVSVIEDENVPQQAAVSGESA